MVSDAGPDQTAHGNASRPDRTADTGNSAHGAAPDLTQVARDWVTLWQSEMNAMAADPEMRESWQAMMAIWASTMTAVINGMPHTPHDGMPGRARPADAPRSTAAAAASDPRDAEIERLARHVAALERRLADVERGRPQVDPARRPRRKSKG